VFFRKKRAQTISEYVILITLVVASVVSMFVYVKRGTQGLIGAAADQIGSQYNAEQDFSGKGGYISNSDTTTAMVANQHTYEWPGTILKTYRDTTETVTNMSSNLGWTEN
jgi:hypothetical protein